MLTESSDASPELSTINFSYEALQTAKWDQLERFTVEVLRRYYEPFGLSVRRTEKRSTTDVGGDGSRDAEGTIVLGNKPQPIGSLPNGGATPPLELGILITLWIEVKKRSHENADAHDFGGTLFRSSIEHVTKLVFVCNRGFTRRFRDDLSRSATHSGTQYALIDGQGLIRIAEEVLGSGDEDKLPSSRVLDQSQPKFNVQLHFALDQLFRHAEIPTGVMERAAGEPVFIEADCKVGTLAVPYSEVRVDLHFQGEMQITIAPRSGTRQCAIGTGDCFRAVFAIFANRACKLPLGLFVIRIVDSAGDVIECSITRGHEICFVRGTLLPAWIPPSRVLAGDTLRRLIAAWLSSGGTQAVDVQSIAGAGKTHLVRALRPLWLAGGAHEVFLDGGGEQTASTAALALLGQLFPIPMDEVTSELSAILTEWLTWSGLPEASAASLASTTRRRMVVYSSSADSSLGMILMIPPDTFSSRFGWLNPCPFCGHSWARPGQ
jgi:hypothetical protein